MTNKTRKYLEERRANKAYWAERSIEKNDRLISDAEAVAKELEKGYASASKLIEQEIKKIFRGFENAFDLSEAEAKRLVALSDGKAPSKAIMQAISMISDPDKRKQMLAEVSSGAYKYRIDRLDKLAKQAEEMSKSLYASELRTDRAFLASEMDKAYKHAIFDLQQGTGVSGAFEQLPESRIKQVLNTKWSGKHFSARIWGNTQVLSDTLRQNMIESFITGEGEREAVARIAERFGVASFRARALIRTENTYVTGQAELEAYRNSAVDKYEYASLDDNRRSLVCERLDGKIFFVKKAKPGVNYPPMHPFCRSSTMAVLPSEEELDKEWDTFLGDNVPQDMSFEEWLDGLQPTEDGKLVYTGKSGKTFNDNIDNSTKSGIIDDESISNVPFTLLDVYSDSECETIQRINKDLLDFVRNEPVGTEAIAYYGEKLNEINRHIGISGKVLPVNGIKEKHYIVHNHPSNRTFSPDDLKLFAEDSSAAVLCAQGNNGKYQYFVEKLENYQEINFYIACLDLEKEIYAIADDISLSFEEKVSKAEKIMEEFLNGADKYGVKYIERKN